MGSPQQSQRSPPATVSLDLPVFDGLLLASQSGKSSDPEHTRTEMTLCTGMVEQKARLSLKETRVEGVLHEEENVHVIWLWFRRNKRPKHNEPRDLPRGLGDAINSLQAPRNHHPAGRTGAEAEHGFGNVTG
jgi:hypothetical protein